MTRDTAESAILEWYSRLDSRFLDLVSDYAGKEEFLIEGDSLLRVCFEDERIDFDYGFQLLHAAYVVEQFLSNLTKRGCQYQIAFFDDHRHNCIPPSSKQPTRYLLARSVIILHLRRNTLKTSAPSSFEVHVFKSLEDAAFSPYLDSSGAYFVACCDGATTKKSVQKESLLTTSKSENVTPSAENDTEQKIHLRGIICWFMARGLDVALLNGLECLDSKIMTFVIGRKKNASKIDAEAQEEFRGICHVQEAKLLCGDSLFGSAKQDTDTRSQSPEEHKDEMAGPAVTELELIKDLRVSSSLRMRSSTIELDQAMLEDPLNGEYPMTARLLIMTLALRQMQPIKKYHNLSSALLLHSILLNQLPVSSRRLKLNRFDECGECLYDDFLQHFCRASQAVLDQVDWTQVAPGAFKDIADLLDGRLLRNVIAALQEGRLKYNELPLNLHDDFVRLQRMLLDTGRLTNGSSSSVLVSGVDIIDALPRVLEHKQDSASSNFSGLCPRDTSVMAFSHPSFDKHLTSIKISVKTTNEAKSNSKVYKELTHWHNSKKLLVPKKGRPTLDAWQKKRADRSNQRFMAEMTAYAASLTNANGKSLTPEPIIVDNSKHGPPKKQISKAPTNKENSRTATPDIAKSVKTNLFNKANNKNDKIAQEKVKREKDRNASTFDAWIRVRAGLDEISDPQLRYSRLLSYHRDVSERKNVEVVVPEVELYRLLTLMQLWSSSCRAGTKATNHHIAALIFDCLQRLAILDLNCPLETPKILKDVAYRCDMPLPPIVASGDHRLSFPFSLQTSVSMSLQMDPIEFCLTHTGPYMDRDMESTDDPRVPFRPDGWQRTVLDELDAGTSLLVVAPTSSGKTFISFYAMERVLRAGDEDVVVYVAPTKALVNQIAAEVQARFSKIYKHAGKSLTAIHTRDYRVNNPTQCQVLVTVPHILQIMLLSPSNAKTWVPRVKTIIFDEVHSIGQAEDGVVWEQLLLMAPCQIIALSATVGNPSAFIEWLSTTQNSIGVDLRMIEHEHRFSDLRKFIYVPPKDFNFVSLPASASLAPLGLESVSDFAFIHPVVCLTNEKRGMPDDLALESRDCFILYQVMVKYQTNGFQVPSHLSPSKSLPKHHIGKADVIKWGKELKLVLRDWMKQPSSPFRHLVRDLGRPLYDTSPRESLEVVNGHKSDGTPIDLEDLTATTLPMLSRLHATNALPALLFHYDRSGCEQIGYALVDQLVEAERHWKATDASWKAKIAAFEEWKRIKESKKNVKVAEASNKKTKKKKNKGDGEETDQGELKMSKTDRSREQAQADDHRFEGFDPDAPCPGFSFAGDKNSDVHELQKVLRQLKWRGTDEKIIEGFRRGVGIHHAGLNRRLRQAVEVWFRKGFLRVVVATGTLSLGINMPCKTVVFSGDSVYLTALNFRQAAGRAGRRGFDLLGNVVFQGISVEKACRLLSSRLPDLNGHFPLTTTLVLRLLNLLHESKSAPYAVQMVNSMLSQPRLYLGGESFKHQVLHHLRFSIEYLRVQGLIGPLGEPLNFTPCVSDLYFTENGAFAFHALLKGGYFHQLSKGMRTNEIDTLRILMIVMSNLFARRPCRLVEKEHEIELVKRSPSVVFLPGMPVEAVEIMKQHNIETLRTYETYVRTFAEQHCHSEDNTLPFTGVTITTNSSDQEASNLLFLAPLPPTRSRSSFVALSGHGDHFESISDLCSSARDGIFLEKAVVPHLDVGSDLSAPLNAYLYDFFQHGSVQALGKANGIRRGDIWYLLNDFSMVLATLVTSLQNFLRPGEDGDVDMTMVGGLADQTELEKDFMEEELDGDGVEKSKEGEQMVQTHTTEAASKVHKKAKVVDDWDAASESDDGEDPKTMDAGMAGSEEGSEGSVDERGLVRVLVMMKKLQERFNEKFRPIFA